MTRDLFIKIIGDERTADIILAKPCMKQDFHCAYKTWRKRLAAAFVTDYPDKSHILQMMCDALEKPVVQWRDMTKLNLRIISDYINSKTSPNTANTYIHVILGFLNKYTEEKVMPVKNLRGVMKSKRVPSQHIALTMDELEKFDAYEPKNDMERDVKCLFMRACYTGARTSDAKKLDWSCVSGGYISYVSQKTETEVVLPMHKNLKKYLDYKVTKEYYRQQTKRTVQKICKAIGMTQPVSLFVGGERKSGEKWQFITMHSARRTFCTVLASMGVNVETIRTLAGHSSTAMTDRYICLDGRDPGKDAMRFFKGEAAAV